MVLVGLTASDPAHVTGAFHGDLRRFNVAITRARLKLVVVASPAYFSALPTGGEEEALEARGVFAAFERACAERGGRFTVR